MRGSMKLLQALKGNLTETPPVWLMRQAGRYLPEYKELRKKAAHFIDFCQTPSLAAEATLQPLRRFDLDAAIIFSDILIIPHALGQRVRFVEGEGPKLDALQTPESLKSLSLTRLSDGIAPTCEALVRVRSDLSSEKALIGFAGAPWTVACYMLEGEGSKTFEKAKIFAYKHPEAFQDLLDLLTEATTESLSAQIKAGADCIQLFESWGGAAPFSLFEQAVLKPAQRIIEALRDRHPSTPLIAFPKGIGLEISTYAEKVKPDALSLDDTISPNRALETLPFVPCLQGGLDPMALLAGGEALETQTQILLERYRNRPFIFNLGHGISQHTPISHVEHLLQHIRSFERHEKNCRHSL